jgi:hypothetical protein
MQSLRPFEIAVHECAYQFAHFPRQQIRGYTDHSDRAGRQKRKSQSIIAAQYREGLRQTRAQFTYPIDVSPGLLD